MISWPSPTPGWELQQTTDLTSTTSWSAPSESITDNGTTKSIVVQPPLQKRLYRLKKP